MKNNRSVAIGVVIFSVVAIIVIVASLFNAPAAIPPASTATPVSGTPLSTATPDLCSTENMPETIAGLEKLSREFEDIYNIAAITPSAQLTPLTTELQRVRREAEDYDVPACLIVLKEYQIDSMNAYIEALMALIAALQVNVEPVAGMTQQQYDQAVSDALSPYYALANQRINDASSLTNKYIVEKARLLGVTLVPTPTAPPVIGTDTPTPASVQ